MATNFPTSLDTLTNPTATDTLDSPPHDTQHADANDAIEAIQAKVGIDSSAVTTSLDYRVGQLELGGGSMTTSSTAPSSPSDGDMWYDTDDGRTYVYYDDGTSQQWVEFGAPPTGSSIALASYADSAARAAAIPSPTEADLSYLQDTNKVEVYDGSAWTGVGGLVHISRTTIGTAVSSVTVSGAFSSDYDAYRVVIANVDGSVSTAALRIRFGAVVTGYYGSRRVDLYTGSTSTIVRDNNAASCQVGIIATSDNSNSIFDIQSPNLANWTNFYGFYNGSGYTGWFGGLQNSTTQFTAFDILPDSGTITGGTIDVYGYAKA